MATTRLCSDCPMYVWSFQSAELSPPLRNERNFCGSEGLSVGELRNDCMEMLNGN